MNRSWKFHLKAVLGMSATIILIFAFSGAFKDKEPEKLVISPYKIFIMNADWGTNCTDEIRYQLKYLGDQLTAGPISEEQQQYIQEEIDEIGELPAPNNALNEVQLLCEGRTSCSLSFGEGALPYESSRFCNYELNVRYLCHRFGKIKELNMAYGDVKTIECDKLE